MSHERANPEMLVRAEGISGGPAVPVSLRIESVQAPSTSASEFKRMVLRRQASTRRANESYARIKADPERWAEWKVRRLASQKAWNARNVEKIRESNKLRARRIRKNWSEERWEIERARCRKSYARHREKRLAEIRVWKKANKAKVRAYKKKWRLSNPDKFNARQRARYARHAESRRAYLSKWRYGDTARLGNTYIRHRLSQRTSVPRDKWPDELVELKRTELKLKRHLKQLWQNQTTSPNSATNSLTPSTP